MWTLLKAAYGDYSYNRQETGKPGQLDPILCARKVEKDTLKMMCKCATQIEAFFAVPLLRMLFDERQLREKIDVSGAREIKFTNIKYREHFQNLVEWKLLEECAPETITFFSTYFSVPKDATLDRSIFNGRRLSMRTKTPPSVNLADVPRVLNELRMLSEKNPQGFNVVCGDIRHWFHQLEMAEDNSRCFGLAMKIDNEMKTYRWRGLPMGWSWSPTIAQGAAWILITYAEPDEERFVDMNLNWAPMFVPIRRANGEELGFMTVYYDNYIIACVDDRVTQILEARIRRNARKFNIMLKEHTTWSVPKLIRGGNNKPMLTFLGVDLAFEKKRSRDDDSSLLMFVWRQHQIENSIASALLPGPRTPKEISSTIGKIIYGRLLTLRPLGEHVRTRRIIDILRKTSAAAWRTSWGSRCCTLTEDERADIQYEWANVVQPPWITPHPVIDEARTVYLATDACGEGWAWVIVTKEGEVLRSSSQLLFPPMLKDAHIYLKELYAVVHGIKEAQRLFPTMMKAVVVCDNTAVVGTVKRRYSTNMIGMSLVSEIAVDVDMISIPSAYNVADAPSRNRRLDHHCLKETVLAILGDRKGQKIGVGAPFLNPTGGVRHEEPPDDEKIESEGLECGQFEIIANMLDEC